jgi:hypothetical protein
MDMLILLHESVGLCTFVIIIIWLITIIQLMKLLLHAIIINDLAVTSWRTWILNLE